VALATAIGGCTAAASSSSVTGNTLSIYVSVPPGSLSPQAQDVLDAERLALQQAGTQIGNFKIKLVMKSFGRHLSDNARQAIGDSTTIAYLGEIAPGDSGQTLGITNAQDVLQVSPTDTAVELTQTSPAVANSPTKYYESLSANGRTFARVVPTDALEAQALINGMKGLGVTRLYIVGDGSAYSNALASAVRGHASPSISIVTSPAGADGILYTGSSAAGAATALNQAAAGNPAVKLFASSALAQQSFTSALSPAAQRNLYISQPGFTASDLPPAGTQFVSAFRAAYGHPPATEAIFGYEAAAALVSVLKAAGASADNRSTVVHKFFAISNRDSALGTYSINHNGDTSIAPFVLSRVRGGQLVPYRAVPAQG
jgi:ABC-type branched-subunit amino acid transport system substrate-binding protein